MVDFATHNFPARVKPVTGIVNSAGQRLRARLSRVDRKRALRFAAIMAVNWAIVIAFYWYVLKVYVPAQL